MLRDGTSGDWIGSFVGHKGAVWSCRLDPSASLAATASGDFSVQVWDAITGKSLFHFSHGHIVKSCDFSPNSKWLATGGHEGILRIFDLQRPKAAPLEITQDAAQKIAISKCCWLSDEVLLTGCADGNIRFWNVPAGAATSPPPTAPAHVLHTDGASEIRDMEITTITTTSTTPAAQPQPPQQILTVAAGSTVYFFNLTTRTLLHQHKMPIHFRDEGGASLHPSGTKFVAGGSDLWVRVFSVQSGQQLECLKGHHGPIRCLRYSPDGTTYASGSEDGTIRLWKTDPEESS